MSKEHYFRLVSNIRDSTELVPQHLTVKNADDVILGDDKVQLIKAHDEWLLRFTEVMYQSEVQELVKGYGKEINTYDDLGKFQEFCFKNNTPFESIPKIYYIENNGEEHKNE